MVGGDVQHSLPKIILRIKVEIDVFSAFLVESELQSGELIFFNGNDQRSVFFGV